MIPNHTLQRMLAQLGFYKGVIDGVIGEESVIAISTALKHYAVLVPMGERTTAVAQIFLASCGLAPGPIDGRYGPKTNLALVNWYKRNIRDGVLPFEVEVPEWYGEPGANQTLIPLPYEMRLAWDKGTTVSRMRCHDYVAPQMESLFYNVRKRYGLAKIKELGLDLFGGCLNVRRKRGGSSWSMHAWGIAVDIDPLNNPLRAGADRARLAQPDYAAFWSIVEEHGAVSYGHERNMDWQHFQFARWR